MFRILQFGAGYNPGGVERFILNYQKNIKPYGIVFDYICMYDDLAFKEEIAKLGGKIFYVPNVKKNPLGYKKAVEHIIKKYDYKCVHVNMLSAANIVPLKISKKLKVPMRIAHSHNIETVGFLRKFLHNKNKKNIEKYATHLFACSKEAGIWLFGKENWDKFRIYLIPNAIDYKEFDFSLEKRNSIKKKNDLSTGEIVVGNIGRFQEQKNHKKILHIFSEYQKINKNSTLLLIGDGELKHKIEELATSLEIRNKVIFKGSQSDIQGYLSAMDLLLFPSLFEGLPFTLVEAQCNNLNILLSDTISNEVVINNNLCNFLSLEDGDEKWARSIDEILKDNIRCNYRDIETLLKKTHFHIGEEARKLSLIYREANND